VKEYCSRAARVLYLSRLALCGSSPPKCYPASFAGSSAVYLLPGTRRNEYGVPGILRISWPPMRGHEAMRIPERIAFTALQAAGRYLASVNLSAFTRTSTQARFSACPPASPLHGVLCAPWVLCLLEFPI